MEGKVCIVTIEGPGLMTQGAASGIGLATVRRFLAEGAEGVTLVDVSSAGLQTVSDSFDLNQRARTIIVVGDVGDEATATQYISETLNRWGRLDVSVQCAGVSQRRTPMIDVDPAVLDRLWKINVRGAYIGVQSSIKAMLASPSGGRDCSIVLISSQIGLDGCTGLSAYAPTKFAVRGIASCAAQEYGPLGIRVNTVCPGPIDTPLLSDVPPELMEPHIKQTNLRRLGEADELASAIFFFASDQGSYCSGTTLKVDGGWSKHC